MADAPQGSKRPRKSPAQVVQEAGIVDQQSAAVPPMAQQQGGGLPMQVPTMAPQGTGLPPQVGGTPSRGARQAPNLPPQIHGEPVPPFPQQKQEAPGLESRLQPRPAFQAQRYHAADKLRGKAALITGGDSGIGRAVAVLFAREGADVAIACLPQEQSDAEETRRHVEAAGRRCLLMTGDLTDAHHCDDLVARTVRAFGRLDVLVSNAAHQARKQTLDEVTDDEFDRTFKTNVYAYFRLVRAALRHMQPGAAIIATSSETGLLGSAALPDYSASKGAINAFTKAMAPSLLERGIRINAVAPGPVWTPLNPSDPGESPDKVAQFGKQAPIGRPAQPEELAPAYVFLASDADSSYMTGTILPVMGGETIGG